MNWLPTRTLILLLLSLPAQAISIDLHSHLFMKPGVGPLLRGDFDQPTKAKSPKNRYRTKMTGSSLDPSGLRLIVVSFYAHPILGWGKTQDALLREIAQLEAFVAENPDWVIAAEPSEARTALAAGKRVFVLSIETAGGILETKADQDLFIEQKKIRIVTFMHLSPDALGRGVALWPGVGIFNAPLEVIQAWFSRSVDPETGAYVNPYGLSAHGKVVLEDLAKRRVWIDHSHSSDQAIHDMAPILDRYAQPSLFTHTRLRSHGSGERAVPRFALERVRGTGGIVGLVPTDDLEVKLPASMGLPEECRKGIRNFAEEWRRMVEIMGSADSVMLGSDFNAPLHGLKGGCDLVGDPADREFSQRGFYRGEDIPQLSAAMHSVGVDPEPDSARALGHFLSVWEKVRSR